MATNSELIAEALVTLLNGGSYSQTFTAVVPLHEPDLERESAGIGVQVIPHDESDEREGRYAYRLTHAVNILITAGLLASLTRKQMNAFRDELRTTLRARDNHEISGANLDRLEVIVSWSLTDKQQRDQYSALLRAYYVELVVDDGG